MLQAMKAALEIGLVGLSGSSGGINYLLIAQDPDTGAKLMARPLVGEAYGGATCALRLHLHPSGPSETIQTSEGVQKTVYFKDHAAWGDAYPMLPWSRTSDQRRAGEIAVGVPSKGPKDLWAAGEHFVKHGGARLLWKALTTGIPKAQLKVTQDQFTTFINAAMREIAPTVFHTPEIPTVEGINATIAKLQGKVAALQDQIAGLNAQIAEETAKLEQPIKTLADMLPTMPKSLTPVKPINEVEAELQGWAKEPGVKNDEEVDDGDDDDDGDED